MENTISPRPPHARLTAGRLVGERAKPGRDAEFSACELSTDDFANLAWTPQGRLEHQL
jgi:hypothetical protein